MCRGDMLAYTVVYKPKILFVVHTFLFSMIFLAHWAHVALVMFTVFLFISRFIYFSLSSILCTYTCIFKLFLGYINIYTVKLQAFAKMVIQRTL